MKGLLLKDIFNLKQQGKIYLIFLGVWIAIGITSKDLGYYGGIMILLGLIVPINAIAYDEKSNWEKFALAMPVSRTDMVTSKYLLSLLCSLTGGVIATAAGAYISGDLTESMLYSATFTSLGMIVAAIVMPLVFKYGVEKARLILLVVFLAPTIIGIILSRMDIPAPNMEILDNLTYMLPFAAIVLILCSIAISQKIYKHKEF